MSAHLDLLMFAAACLVLLMGFPVAFTLAGVALAFGLIGQSLDIFDMGFFYALPQRIFGTMTNEVLIAVPLFVFMGTMLERARVAEDLLENMSRLFAGVRGGLGISVSIVGALLAASTGIVGATVVTMSLLSLPTMLRRGYAPVTGGRVHRGCRYARANYSTLHRAGSARRCYRQCLSEGSTGTGYFCTRNSFRRRVVFRLTHSRPGLGWFVYYLSSRPCNF